VPPLLCASPCILDQSFPRSVGELQDAAETLGHLAQLVEDDIIHLVLPEALEEFVTETDWDNRGQGQYALLLEIHRLIEQWFLQPHDRLVHVDTANVQNYYSHPLPQGATSAGWTELWADETGRLLKLHDEKCGMAFCIGVACEKGFCEETPSAWENPNGYRCFPLVSPEQIKDLEDAYTWKTPPDLHLRHLSFETALRNVRFLGATGIDCPRGGSHYKIHFSQARSWILDKNVDPVPDRFIGELVGITGFPLEIIRNVLIFGQWPERVLKIEQ
jgi:hypothetical protein